MTGSDAGVVSGLQRGAAGFLLAALLGVAPAAAQPGPVWIGVMGSDGVVIPFARHDAGGWSAPWPEPVMDREPPPPPSDAPSEWYVYTTRSPDRAVRVREVARTPAYCEETWGQLTDWQEARPVRPGYSRSISAMVLSEPLTLIEEDSIPGIAAYRSRAGLVSNPTEGEGYRESRALGYLRVGPETIGVFLERGYEGQSYEVHRVAGDARERVVQVRGGGC